MRQYREIDVAVLPRIATRAGAEQPNFSRAVAKRIEHYTAQALDGSLANRVQTGPYRNLDGHWERSGSVSDR